MPTNPCSIAYKRSKLVIFENGRSATFLNPERSEVTIHKVDGCLLKQQLAADYVVSKADVCQIIVELKGTDVNHGIKQIQATASFWIESQLSVTCLSALIVCRRYPRINTGIQRGKVLLWKEHEVRLRVEARNLVYNFEEFQTR